MDFKSSPDNFGSADFRRALVISLVLHAMLLWQKWPTATGSLSQSGPSKQATVLNAALRNNSEPSAPAATFREYSARKPTAIPNQIKRTPILRPSVSPDLPKPAPEIAEPAGDGVDANGILEYRLRLAVAARDHKLYPLQALEKGWSGTAEVRIAVAANGASQVVQLLHSSGHDLLDAAAIEMVGDAARRTVVPASLRGQSFSVPLPVVFDYNGK